MGRGKGCPSALGGHWFGDAASESYHILRSSCAGLPPRSPRCPRLPQTATPSAWPPPVVLTVSALLSLLSSLGIYGSTSSVHDLSLCFVIHAQGSLLSACVPQVLVSEPASQKSEVHDPPQGFAMGGLAQEVGGPVWGCPGVRGLHGPRSRVRLSLSQAPVRVHARMWLGFRGSVSRTAVADVQIRGSA